MSKLTRLLLLAVLLAAMTQAGGTAVAQEQTAADAALRRALVQEHSYTFGQPPAAATSAAGPAAPAQPSGRPVAALGVLAAGLALAGTLVVRTRRRPGRGVRARRAT
jgi:hypothetical protein